jgi:DNA-binding CsgD family transcriptional regulator/PAS domain-containing protein
MPEIEQLSDLIGDIYDTTLDRSLWPGVLARISRFIDGAAAAVFWNDAANGQGDIYFDDGGIAPYYKALYFEKYVRLNPTVTARFFSDPEEPASTGDLVPYDEFLQSRLYREWAKPQQLVDFVSVILEKASTKTAMFGVFRNERQGLVDEETRRRMRLLAPHVRRAVLIAKVVDFKQAEAATFAEIIDGLRAGMILVDRAGRIVHANAAAHALLAEKDALRTIGGRLSASDPQIERALAETFAVAAEGDAAVGAKGVALPLAARTGELYVAHVLPLAAGARRRAGSVYAATAAVFLHKATLEPPAPPVALAKAYKLTLAEVRVLFAIVEIGGVPEVADVLGVASSTVKTHLGRIYEKTGVSRQADLVKLVAGCSSPLLQ